jgi:hypothetical protein
MAYTYKTIGQTAATVATAFVLGTSYLYWWQRTDTSVNAPRPSDEAALMHKIICDNWAIGRTNFNFVSHVPASISQIVTNTTITTNYSYIDSAIIEWVVVPTNIPPFFGGTKRLKKNNFMQGVGAFSAGLCEVGGQNPYGDWVIFPSSDYYSYVYTDYYVANYGIIYTTYDADYNNIFPYLMASDWGSGIVYSKDDGYGMLKVSNMKWKDNLTVTSLYKTITNSPEEWVTNTIAGVPNAPNKYAHEIRNCLLDDNSQNPWCTATGLPADNSWWSNMILTPGRIRMWIYPTDIFFENGPDAFEGFKGWPMWGLRDGYSVRGLSDQILYGRTKKIYMYYFPKILDFSSTATNSWTNWITSCTDWQFTETYLTNKIVVLTNSEGHIYLSTNKMQIVTTNTSINGTNTFVNGMADRNDRVFAYEKHYNKEYWSKDTYNDLARSLVTSKYILDTGVPYQRITYTWHFTREIDYGGHESITHGFNLKDPFNPGRGSNVWTEAYCQYFASPINPPKLLLSGEADSLGYDRGGYGYYDLYGDGMTWSCSWRNRGEGDLFNFEMVISQSTLGIPTNNTPFDWEKLAIHPPQGGYCLPSYQQVQTGVCITTPIVYNPVLEITNNYYTQLAGATRTNFAWFPCNFDINTLTNNLVQFLKHVQVPSEVPSPFCVGRIENISPYSTGEPPYHDYIYVITHTPDEEDFICKTNKIGQRWKDYIPYYDDTRLHFPVNPGNDNHSAMTYRPKVNTDILDYRNYAKPNNRPR